MARATTNDNLLLLPNFWHIVGPKGVRVLGVAFDDYRRRYDLHVVLERSLQEMMQVPADTPITPTYHRVTGRGYDDLITKLRLLAP